MRARDFVLRAYERRSTGRRVPPTSNTEILEDLIARALTWQQLPAPVQRSLCTTYLEHPASPTVLPHLQRMFERSSFDERLVALCVKLHCDLQQYSEAYRVLEYAIVLRSRDVLAQFQAEGASKIEVKNWLIAYQWDLRPLTGLWGYIDLEARRDTAERHVVGGELGEILNAVCREFARIAPAVRPLIQAKVMFALLDLAKVLLDEGVVRRVAELFLASACKEDVGTYARFARSMTTMTLYSRNLDERQHYLVEFRRWLSEKIPDEAALAKLVKTLRRAEAAKEAPGEAAPNPKVAEFRVLFRLLVALDMAGMNDLVFRVVQQTLADAGRRIDVIDYCVTFESLRNESARALAFHTLQAACRTPRITRRNVRRYLVAFLMLADRDQILALEEKGLLDPRYGHREPDLAVAYAMLGKFGRSLAQVQHLKHENIVAFAKRTPGSLDRALGQERILDDLQFLKTTNDVLNEVPQPRAPRGIVVLAAKNARELNMYPILAIRELKAQGFAVVSLVAMLLDYEPTGIAEIDHIADQLNAAMDHARWQDDTADVAPGEWTLDPGARKMAYRDIDVYWGVREDLACRDRRYTVDFASPSKQYMIADSMRRIEVFDVCVRRIADIGQRLRLPVRLIFPYVHLGSHYYARRLVESLAATHDIALLHVANAYENFFTNFGSDEATTLAVRDMTLHRDLAGAYFVPTECFDRYYGQLSPEEREQLVAQVENVTTQHRVQRQVGIGQSDRLDFLARERRAGRKIVCLMGKVLFDLEMPHGDGPAHGDMREWFDHTLAIAAAHPDVQLLIKPHPHEIRDEIALYASEFLKDWVPADLPPNIHLLGHNEFNIFELIPVLDLALLWAGTAALELGVMRVPTVIGAYYGHIDYPVCHVLPESRAHYEELLVAPTTFVPPADVRLRAAALLTYFRHPDNSIPYRYTHRGLTNRSIRNLRWFDEDLQAYRAKGDPHVTRIASRIAGNAALTG